MSACILAYVLVQEWPVPKCELRLRIKKLERITPVKSLLEQIPYLTPSQDKNFLMKVLLWGHEHILRHKIPIFNKV